MENSDATAQALMRQWAEKHGSSPDSAFMVGLSGHLGAGKTAFVKRVAKELGVSEVVASPTFVIMKIYESGAPGRTGASSAEAPFKRLIHIDAYRLERREDLEALAFERVAADPNSLVMIEWPENAGLAKSDLDAWLSFRIDEGAYTISF